MRQVREQCSSEMWEQLNRLYLQVLGTPTGEAWLLHSQLFFRSVQDGAHLFQGVTNSTMSHDEGWHLYLSRPLRGAHPRSRGLDRQPLCAAFPATPSKLAVDSDEYLEWVGLLKSCTAFEAYCKKYTAEIRPMRVAEFLLLSPDFPHSVRFSVERIHSALQAVGDLTDRKASAPMRLAGRLRASLSFTQIEEIMAEGLDSYLANIRTLCAQAHTAIHQIYFDYPVESAMVS